jgi:hypothetical protein
MWGNSGQYCLLRLSSSSGDVIDTLDEVVLGGPPIESAVALEHLEDRRLHPVVRVLDVDASIDIVGIEAVVLALTDVCLQCDSRGVPDGLR